MKLKGVVKELPLQTIISKKQETFYKYQMILVIGEDELLLEKFLGKETTGKPDVKNGDNVECIVKLETREWNGKWFQSASLDEIAIAGSSTKTEPVEAKVETNEENISGGENDDDLPF